jgi:thymidylate synthase (FAD)
MKAEYIDHLGSDLTVVNAARVSFDKESDWANPWYKDDGEKPYLKEGDKGLISYLARHGHWTPFSHPQITLRYTVPIFVARQEFKHIVGFTRNEVSRRYVDEEPEFYVPEVWRSRPEGSVKQGSGVEEVDIIDTLCVTGFYSHIRKAYAALLDKGVAPEQARMVLPQSMYTSYYITGSLAAFARFYRQRTDPHAQQEIQELAHQVGSIIEPLFPSSWNALCNQES